MTPFNFDFSILLAVVTNSFHIVAIILSLLSAVLRQPNRHHANPFRCDITSLETANLNFFSDFLGVVKLLDLFGVTSCPTPSFFNSLKMAIESCVDSRFSFFFNFFFAEEDFAILPSLDRCSPPPLPPTPPPLSVGVRGASRASLLAAGEAGALCVTSFLFDDWE